MASSVVGDKTPGAREPTEPPSSASNAEPFGGGSEVLVAGLGGFDVRMASMPAMRSSVAERRPGSQRGASEEQFPPRRPSSAQRLKAGGTGGLG